MLSAFRCRSFTISPSSSSILHQSWKLGFTGSTQEDFYSSTTTESNSSSNYHKSILELQEIQKVLSDVKADHVKVIASNQRCDWVDHIVIATGRSTWHVKNIAGALIHKAKEKQKGVRRMMLPSVEGRHEGKWIVIDSGNVIVHALDENARAYYNLEGLWTPGTSQQEPDEDMGKAFVKVRPKNNSKKPQKPVVKACASVK